MEPVERVWQTSRRRHRLRMEAVRAEMAAGELTVWVDVADAARDAGGLERFRAAVLEMARRAGWCSPVTIVEADSVGIYDMGRPASVDEVADIIGTLRLMS